MGLGDGGSGLAMELFVGYFGGEMLECLIWRGKGDGFGFWEEIPMFRAIAPTRALTMCGFRGWGVKTGRGFFCGRL